MRYIGGHDVGWRYDLRHDLRRGAARRDAVSNRGFGCCFHFWRRFVFKVVRF
jgi:hypothetical protein